MLVVEAISTTPKIVIKMDANDAVENFLLRVDSDLTLFLESEKHYLDLRFCAILVGVISCMFALWFAYNDVERTILTWFDLAPDAADDEQDLVFNDRLLLETLKCWRRCVIIVFVLENFP